MKKLIIFNLLIVILAGCATEKTDFNRLQDRNGLFYLINKEKPFTGEVISYAGGKVEFEGTIDNGLREGVWVYYYPNGQKEIEGSFKEGVREGTWTYWQENGQQEKTELYKYGRLISNNDSINKTPRDTATSTSRVKKEEATQEKKPEAVRWERLHGGPVKYLDGVPYTGPVVKYFRNGVKEFEGYFTRGHRSGKWINYYPTGNVRDVKYY